MAVASTRVTAIAFSGDMNFGMTVAAAQNSNAPGDVDIMTLSSGANTISLPTGGSAPQAATIIPPVGNTIAITLKGVTGDTGIPLHLTDPTIVAFATTVTNFVLTAGAPLAGVRIVWT